MNTPSNFSDDIVPVTIIGGGALGAAIAHELSTPRKVRGMIDNLKII